MLRETAAVMPRISVQVKFDKLPAIAQQLPDTADVIVNGKYGHEMVSVAKSHSRVDTGEMRDGWEWHPTGNGEGELVNDVAHTIHNEYGTRNMSAQPMARPALEEVGPKIVAEFERLEKYLA